MEVSGPPIPLPGTDYLLFLRKAISLENGRIYLGI
jgi:hypothetical protein